MNQNTTSEYILPTLLVLNNNQTKLVFDSSIVTSLNQVHISILAASKIISWVQQYQPDLIVIDLEWLSTMNLQLIAALRLDWLTRNIPIMLIASSTKQQAQCLANLDYDACLTKPYSETDLGKAICSLISTPACKV